MSRRSWVLFFVPVLIWSTTFYAITLQLGSVTAPTYAVALRFGAASVLLFIWLTVRREAVALPQGAQVWAAASGVCAYGISYVLTYVAEQTIPSGMVAIAFTLMVFLTPALARVVYGTPTPTRTWIGGALGVIGVVLCFLPDALAALAAHNSAHLFTGMAAMTLAAFVSSVGAICSMKLNERKVPVVTYSAWAMAYGACASLLYGAASGQVFVFDPRPAFWAAFAYLTLAGTLITFLCYLTLLKREGSARAMYISVLSPVGAVIVSILIEGLKPQALTALGMASALAGAWITLQSKRA